LRAEEDRVLLVEEVEEEEVLEEAAAEEVLEEVVAGAGEEEVTALSRRGAQNMCALTRPPSTSDGSILIGSFTAQLRTTFLLLIHIQTM
jgi:hypothetical protein